MPRYVLNLRCDGAIIDIKIVDCKDMLAAYQAGLYEEWAVREEAFENLIVKPADGFDICNMAGELLLSVCAKKAVVKH